MIPVALVVAIGAIAQFFIWVEADVAWLLTVARRMNDGAVLYSRDLVEFNPPLVMQLSQLAVLASRWIAFDTVLAFRLLVILAAVGSLWLSWRLLSDTLPDADDTARASAALLLAAAFTCLPGLMFGQREHFVVLGFTPYLIGAGRSARRLPVAAGHAVAIGVLLALAVSIKPHYALAIVLVEIAVCVHRREWLAWWRAETAVGAVMLLVVQGITAVQFPGYLSFAVPLAIDYYPAYGDLHIRTSYVVYLVAALATLPLRGLTPGLAVQRQVFTLAGIGAFGGYLAQGQGWEYQFLPAQTFFVLAVIFGWLTPALTVARRVCTGHLWLSPTTFTWVCLIALVSALVVMTTVRTIRINRHERTRIVSNVRTFIEGAWSEGRPRTMASLTLSLFPAAPVAELVHAEWGSRFSCLWLMPGIETHEAAAQAGREPAKGGRAYLESAVIEDFVRWQPTLVLVERDAPRMLDEVLKAPAFRAEWQHYRSVGTVEGVEVFRRQAP